MKLAIAIAAKAGEERVMRISSIGWSPIRGVVARPFALRAQPSKVPHDGCGPAPRHQELAIELVEGGLEPIDTALEVHQHLLEGIETADFLLR